MKGELVCGILFLIEREGPLRARRALSEEWERWQP